MFIFPTSDLIILQTQKLVVITFISKHFELNGIGQREQDRNAKVQRKGSFQVIIPHNW